MPDSPHQTRWLLILIMAALVGWGLFHALGMLWKGDAAAALRALIVLACVLGFLGAWLLALAQRARRIKRNERKR